MWEIDSKFSQNRLRIAEFPLHRLLRGDFVIISYIRTIILYLTLIIVVRLMGKRQVGQLEPSELVVAMLIADLAAVPMQDTGIPLFAGLIPILTVLGIELILSVLTFRFVGFRRLFCGKPVILIEKGKILYKSLKKTRVSINELVEHLRKNGILNPSTVHYAILETDGDISILPYQKYQPACAKDAGIKVQDEALPIAVICDGKWQLKNLAISKVSKTWVEEQLKAHTCPLRDVHILSVAGQKMAYLVRRDT